MKRSVITTKNKRRSARHARIRAMIKGTAECPRLSVFRGLRQMTLQLIDDSAGRTICQVSTTEIKNKKVEGKAAKTAAAYLAGKLLAEKAKEKKITDVVFDRGGYQYHGRVAAVADGAREGGLKF